MIIFASFTIFEQNYYDENNFWDTLKIVIYEWKPINFIVLKRIFLNIKKIYDQKNFIHTTENHNHYSNKISIHILKTK